MSDNYFFSCPKCDEQILLTSEIFSELDNRGFVQCSCGSSIRPDDPHYFLAKKNIESKQMTTYCVYGFAIIIGLAALNFKVPALLPLVALGAGTFIRSLNSNELVEIKSDFFDQ